MCTIQDRGTVSCFCIWVSSSPNTIYWRLSFYHCIILAPLLKISILYILGIISGFYILFHWSICLFLRQYHTVSLIVGFNTVQNQEVWFLQLCFLQDCFAIQDLLWFPLNFRITCSILDKKSIGILIECIESLYCFGWDILTLLIFTMH